MSFKPRPSISTVTMIALAFAGLVTCYAPLHSLVLSPLPYPNPDELVAVSDCVFDYYSNSFTRHEALRSVLSNVSAYHVTEATVSHPTFVKKLTISKVSANFFETLGLGVLSGSDLREYSQHSPIAVISYRLWKDLLGGKQDLTSCTVVMENVTYHVIGVARSAFDFPSETQVWIPLESPLLRSNQYQIVGRLITGTSIQRASVLIRTICYDKKESTLIEPLHTFIHGDREQILRTVWGISILFLLLVCVGVANLAIVQGTHRRWEFMVNMAIGASRSGMIYRLTCESLALVSLGAMLGLCLGQLGLHFLGWFWPNVNRGAAISATSFLIVLPFILIAVLMSGLIPALFVTQLDVSAFLRETGTLNVAASGKRSVTYYDFIVAGQACFAIVLLVCTAALGHSLHDKLSVPLGFNSANVAAMRIDLPKESITSDDSRAENRFVTNRYITENQAVRKSRQYQEMSIKKSSLYERTLSAFAELPDVTDVGVMSPAPFLNGGYGNNIFLFEGLSNDAKPTGRKAKGLVRICSANAFQILAISILYGRPFAANEAAVGIHKDALYIASNSQAGYENPVIINRTLARILWPDGIAVGKHLKWNKEYDVIGVVSDISESEERLDIRPTIYIPFTPLNKNWDFVFACKGPVVWPHLSKKINARISQIIPGLAESSLIPINQAAAKSVTNLKSAFFVLACFSALGLIVSALGVYSVATEVCAKKTQEMAVRAALGATRKQIVLLLICRYMRMLLMAVPLGALGSWVLSMALGNAIVGVRKWLVTDWMICTVGVMLITIAAGLKPAIKVALTTPAQSFRCGR
jgi:hypothetical protein